MGRGQTRVVALGAAWGLMMTSGCSFDSTEAAPYADPARKAGLCGTTDSLLPKFLKFIEADRFAPIRQVVEKKLVPSDTNPLPDPSVRTIAAALLRLLSLVGVERAQRVADLVSDETLNQELVPLVHTSLRILDGQLDGKPKYEVADAAALFVRQCDPDNLLTSIEELLILQSPSQGEPWLFALLESALPLLEDPTLTPFLESFERNAESGKFAVVALMAEIMKFMAAEDFAISRVRTLLESAVYPFASRELETKIRGILVILEEATSEEAGAYGPLQRAMRCGHQHPASRDILLGFLFDLVVTPELGLDGLLEGASALGKQSKNDLDLLSDLVAAVRLDLSIRDDIRDFVALFLSTPEVESVIPVVIELIETEVMGELFSAIAQLLKGCEDRVQ